MEAIAASGPPATGESTLGGYPAATHLHANDTQYPSYGRSGHQDAYRHGEEQHEEYATSDRSTPPRAHFKAGQAPTEAYKLLDDEHSRRGSFSPPYDRRKRRGCCGRVFCSPICWVVTFVLLAGLGVTLFFVFPRIPDVAISDPFVPAGGAAAEAFTKQADKSAGTWTPGLTNSGNPAAATPANPFVLALGLGVNVTVNSANYIPYKVNSINVVGALRDVNGREIVMSNQKNSLKVSAVVNDVTIEPKTQTLIRIPVSVNYTVVGPLTAQTLLQDPVLAVLANACGIPGLQDKQAGAKFRLKVTTTLDLKLVSWTGYKPQIDKDVAFDCPSTISTALAAIFSGMGGGLAAALLGPGFGAAFAPTSD
ncbi:uncharacterized protein EV422DRAFT_581280 [Fimicolochytrium jonesii]|uniref:uncharacterized protein n=1 Tax=Fimicolochytrium jonesii TaxID=1396493 RepID=UPI0022FE48BF|nr:uncharacterized protein EV422DRAFT_581280 [Fimicolochytrium jonesii]KAI8816770.1 hypothetical protein EV422DRAFT_581280 [Fimicolochytrium jonesii]